MGILDGIVRESKHSLMIFLIMSVAVAPVFMSWEAFTTYMPGIFVDFFAWVAAHKAVVLTISAGLFIWEYLKDFKLILLALVVLYFLISGYLLPML